LAEGIGQHRHRGVEQYVLVLGEAFLAMPSGAAIISTCEVDTSPVESILAVRSWSRASRAVESSRVASDLVMGARLTSHACGVQLVKKHL
jgi:hypothetical protein